MNASKLLDLIETIKPKKKPVPLPVESGKSGLGYQP
jgi:hypothetical protein